MVGKSKSAHAKMNRHDAGVVHFQGHVLRLAAVHFRPTTRFAYCTVTLRTPWVTAMTAAITNE